MAKLTSDDKSQLESWLGQGRLKFELIYSASRDGCDPGTFHNMCDNKGPTISVAYNTNGFIFGGYTSRSWQSSQQWQQDTKSFLFRLRANSGNSYVRINSRNAHIQNHVSFGPTFGYPNQFEMQMSLQEINNAQYGYHRRQQAWINPLKNGYQWASENVPSMTGNGTSYSDVKVYMFSVVKEKAQKTSPWRSISFGWDVEDLKKLKTEVSRYKPPTCLKIPSVNVLLVGQVGSGKSSFMNTINSVFRGHVTSRATAGSTEHSLTTMYRMYDIRDHRGSGEKLGFRLCDTMGLEDTQSLDTLGFPYLLDGNIQDRYQFSVTAPFSPKSDSYRASPSLADQCHVVALVVDGSSSGVITSAMLDKVRTLRMHANHRGIPFVIVFTKVDCLDTVVKNDLSKVYHSTTIEENIETLADKLGVPLSQILPIKNYHKETELITAVDMLAISTVRQMLRLADDYFEEQMDILDVEEKKHVKQNIL